MNIDSIVNGVVIDHISAGKAMKLYELLGLEKLDCSVAIIKIDADVPVDFDLIGYVDPDVTINIIRDEKLIEKKTITLPKKLTNVIFCKNPRCITSVERGLEHVFKLTDKKNKIYRCIYCETRAK